MNYPTVSVWSFPKGKKSLEIKTSTSITPGAGTYEPKFGIISNIEKSPSWQIKTHKNSSRVKEKPDMKGPGCYETNTSTLDGPMFTMSRRNVGPKSTIELMNVPGPGKYDPKKFSFMERSRSCQFFNYKPEKITGQHLGPGVYKLQKNLADFQNQYRFPREKKVTMHVKDTKSPGPGKYDIKEDFARNSLKISFSQLERNNYKDNKRPGPGQYKHPDFFGFENPKYTMKPKRPLSTCDNADKKKEKFPGPGKYDQDKFGSEKFSNAPKITISKLPRKDDMTTAYRGSLPPPTKYNPKYDTILNKSLSAEFSKDKEKIKFKTALGEHLGPGKYQQPSFFGIGSPKYSVSLTKKKELIEVNDNPGPADYSDMNVNSVKEKSPIYKIVTCNDKNYQKLKNTNPGPGSYDVKALNLGPYIRMGTFIDKQPKKLDVPGPGTYRVPYSFGNYASYTNGGFARWI